MFTAFINTQLPFECYGPYAEATRQGKIIIIPLIDTNCLHLTDITASYAAAKFVTAMFGHHLPTLSVPHAKWSGV
jgi:hypothetical protein